MAKRLKIRIRGIVQGVGFRPFVFNLARIHGIRGEVINDTEGILIEAEAGEEELGAFLDELKNRPPRLSYIYSTDEEVLEPRGFDSFTIGKSRAAAGRDAFYSPDIAVCGDCLREFFDPADRRYHYPFITCINCGPRFSIVNDVPYDRENTTMSGFRLCPDCTAEYSDFSDRRFHAQPIACPLCGPELVLTDPSGKIVSGKTGDIADRCLEFLERGMILAVKSTGGYHLVADAKNGSAVRVLRERKRRPFKPFAIMAGSIESAESFLDVSDEEKALLLSKERPVVLLKQRKSAVDPFVAPGMTYHGVMLPSTPFQHLLFSIDPEMVLIMTSGNLSEEPIAYRDGDALSRLGGIADYFVSYNREITVQSDDSVLFVSDGEPYFVRRARGYVPAPFKSRKTGRVMLALGGDLKNCFAVAKKDIVILSQHLGDMSDMETYRAFRSTVSHFMRVFDAGAELVVTDMHPSYMTSVFGDEFEDAGLKRLRVQHHHAHVVSVMEDADIDGKVIGIAFDGTGYGTDGTLWGSEFLVADRAGFERAAHFSDFPLPGGESAIRDVWKIGLSLLYSRFGRGYSNSLDPAEEEVIEMIDKGISSPSTCSIGRIFDGVASILGISSSVSTEAEAAMLLEEAAYEEYGRAEAYDAGFSMKDGAIEISTGDIIEYIYDRLKQGRSVGEVAALFHRSVVSTSLKAAAEIRERTGIGNAVLSGGAFHNRILLHGIKSGLEACGFRVFVPRRVPFNDGCISLGQIAVAKEIISLE
ncbi:MAG: carbamoyltransferase HypF [Spirochaetes bacterium]|jgi:hydrogenase maturation protein HypF|nr:carbamoyltransferase HypF [Spirochaetota bacterium]